MVSLEGCRYLVRLSNVLVSLLGFGFVQCGSQRLRLMPTADVRVQPASIEQLVESRGDGHATVTYSVATRGGQMMYARKSWADAHMALQEPKVICVCWLGWGDRKFPLSSGAFDYLEQAYLKRRREEAEWRRARKASAYLSYLDVWKDRSLRGSGG